MFILRKKYCYLFVFFFSINLAFSQCPDSSIIVEIDEIQNNSCFNSDDGSVEFTVSGGSGGFSLFEYSIENQSDGNVFINSLFPPNFSNLWAGTWVLTVSEYNLFNVLIDQCSDIEIVITEPSPIEFDSDLDNDGFINSNFTFTDFVCLDENNGSAEVNVGIENVELTYSLIDEQNNILQNSNSGIFNGLSSGCYSIEIFDGNISSNQDCIYFVEFCIEESTPEISSYELGLSGCDVVGSSNFDLSGLQPFDISFYVDEILFAQEVGYNESNFEISSIPSGAVEIIVSDASDCSTNLNFDVLNGYNDINIVNSIVSNPTCTNSNGSLLIDFTNSINVISSESFGNLSIFSDINGDCLIDSDDFLFSTLDIINNNSLDFNITVEDLPPGNYVYSIEDEYGCNASSCFTVENIFLNPDPNIFFTSVDAICYNSSGSAYATLDTNIIGGVPYINQDFNYLINWVNSSGNSVDFISSQSEIIASSLPAGNYSIIITDASDCSFQHDFTINQPEIPLEPGASSTTDDFGFNISCYGESDGEIYIQPVGGQNEYYSISITFPNGNIITDVLTPGLSDTYYINNLSPGEYVVTVDDGVCQPVSQTISILQPLPIEWSVETLPLPCNGDVINWSNGNLTIDNGNSYTYTGGVGSPNLLWYDSPQNCSDINESFALDINSLGSGTYFLYSIDGNNCCTSQGQHTIPETPLFQSDFNPFDSELWIYCPGDNTGIISFNSYGGTPSNGPYTYIWEYNGEYIQQYDNMNVVEGLYSGSYTVSVDDINGCGPILHNIEILQPLPLEVSYSQSNYNGYGISCFGSSDGFIEIDVANGLNPDDNYSYLFTWTDSSGNLVSNEEDLYNVIPGTYYLEVLVDIPSSENLFETCLYNNEFIITDPGEIVVDLIDYSDVTCNGANDANIDIAVTGGAGNYSFSWSNSSVSQNLSNVGPGEYSVTVTDQNGCILTIEDIVSISEPDVFEIDISSNEANNFSEAALCAPGNGNSNSGQISIDLEYLNTFLDGGSPPFSSPLIFDVDGNQVSTLNNNNLLTANFLEGGNYSVVVLDSNGCEISFNIFVPIENIDPISFTPQIIQSKCGQGGGSIYITSIDNGVPPYNISIVNTESPSLSYDFTTSTDFSSFDYNSNDWNNNGIDDYDPDIDGDGLINEIDGDIDGDGVSNYQDFSPYGNSNEDNDGDGILNIDSDFNPSNFGWHQSVPSGFYEITITDDNGCTGILQVSMGIEQIETVDIYTTPASCSSETENTCLTLSNNGSIVINPNSLSVPTLYPFEIFFNGNEYTTVNDWDIDGDGFFDNLIIESLDAGSSHSVEIIDANGCEYDIADNITIPHFSNLNIEIVGFCPECQESSNGGFAYNIISTGGLSNPVFTEDLSFFYTNNNISSCISDIDSDGIINCFDDDMNGDAVLDADQDLDGDGIVNSEDDDVDGDGISDDIDNDIDGDGIINVIDNDIDDVLTDCDNLNNISYNPILTYGELNDNYYFINSEFLLNIPDPNVLPSYHYDYVANFESSYDQVIGGLSQGNYFVTVVDNFGCQFTEEIEINDEICQNEFGSTQYNNCLFIPSVFTPNNDGINDLWDIYNIEIYEPGVIVKLFNRWGQIVYESGMDFTYSDNLWNGKNSNGKDVEIATYYYVIELEGYEKNYTGYVVVKR